jgi:hypothetical protein
MKIPNILKHLADICAEHPKYETACVRVELDPDGTPWAIATDGRILLAATFRPPDGSPPQGAPAVAHVPAKLWTLAHAMAKAVTAKQPLRERPLPGELGTLPYRPPDRPLTLEWEGPALTAGDVLHLSLPSPGTFPPWRDVWEKATTTPHVGASLHGQYVRCRLDAGYLLKVLTVLHSMGLDVVDWHIPVYDLGQDKHKAGPSVGEPWATPLADVKVRGCLMPMQWRE